MTASFIPYGELADGSMGFPLDSSNNPIATAIEILSALPSTGDAANFEGRSVFSTTDINLYVFHSGAWVALKTGQVTVGSPAPSGSAADGTLYYATSNGILYICVSNVWIAIAGKLGAGVIWRHYTGDGVTSLFDTGTGQMPPVEYVEVFIDGATLRPGANGVRDYYMIGNSVQLATTPSTNAKISIRTLLFINPAANSTFFARRYAADGTVNSFDTGAQSVVAGQTMVSVDGVVQLVDTGHGAGTYDYKILTQNNAITSLTSSGTTVTMTSVAAHGYTSSMLITIIGANQSAYNGTFTVVSAPTANTLTYTALTTPSASPATGTIRFGPLTQNDRIVFYDGTGAASPPDNGVVVYVQTVASLVPSF